MSSFSFGSDPEFMLMENGHYVSAIDKIDGSTEKPIMDNGHRFYWDNVLAECAIKPGFSKEESLENFRECLKIYAKLVAPCVLVAQASQDYPKEALQHPKAKEAGCAIDNCCYTMRPMKAELSAKDAIANGILRTAGGHVHVGHDILVSAGTEPIFFVYLLDLFLGVPAMFLDKDKTSPRRKELYGQSGRFRTKEYGIEYRSLGNFWLSSPKLFNIVYDIVDFVVDFIETDQAQKLLKFDEDVYWNLIENGIPTGDAFQFLDFDKQKLKQCIDKHDIKQGKQFLSLAKKYLPSKLMRSINQGKSYDMYKEWGL